MFIHNRDWRQYCKTEPKCLPLFQGLGPFWRLMSQDLGGDALSPGSPSPVTHYLFANTHQPLGLALICKQRHSERPMWEETDVCGSAGVFTQAAHSRDSQGTLSPLQTPQLGRARTSPQSPSGWCLKGCGWKEGTWADHNLIFELY